MNKELSMQRATRETSARTWAHAAATVQPLSAYVRELADVTVMSKEEETAAAQRLVGLRRSLWASVLSYPPFVAAICAVMVARLPEEERPSELLRELLRASQTLRDRDLKVHHDAFHRARDAVAAAMESRDLDGELVDAIVGDLSALGRDRGATTGLAVRPPRRGSAPFFRYLATVRRDQQALVAAKNAFVRANLRLVVSIARRFNRGQVPLSDLIQEGNLGLMRAVGRFDLGRGCRFSTYATWWIRHAMSRAIADKARCVRLPVHMIDACNKVNRARREFATRHGREPTDREVEAASGVSVERIGRMGWSLVEAPVSLARPVWRDGETCLADIVPDPDSVEPAEALDADVLTSQLHELFAELSPLEADILKKRVGMNGDRPWTLKEIGAGHSLSRERIRQLQEQALDKLRGGFTRRGLL